MIPKEREALKLSLEALEKADTLYPVNSEAEIYVRSSRPRH